MRAAALLCLCALAVAEERAFVEVETARDAYFVGERIRVTLRVGVDREFFASNVVALFAQPVDVPVHVKAPWFDAWTATEGALRVALNDNVVDAVRAAPRGGFDVFEIARTIVATEPGDLALAAPVVRFAWGTKFKEDFIHGRVATDRRVDTVAGAARTLKVQALPEAPDGFGGAVGRFAVRATASPTAVDAGGIVKLTLHVEGDGEFEPPRLTLDGFHVYGSLGLVYDIAPLDGGVTEIPSIPFVYFEPGAGYREARTEPIPLTVRGDVPPAPEAETFPWLPFVAVAGIVALFALTRRKRRPDPASAFRGRARDDVAAAFTEFLAERLECPAASVIAPELAARLGESGVPDELAARTAAFVERLVAARYGGSVPESALEEATELVRALAPEN